MGNWICGLSNCVEPSGLCTDLNPVKTSESERAWGVNILVYCTHRASFLLERGCLYTRARHTRQLWRQILRTRFQGQKVVACRITATFCVWTPFWLRESNMFRILAETTETFNSLSLVAMFTNCCKPSSALRTIQLHRLLILTHSAIFIYAIWLLINVYLI